MGTITLDGKTVETPDNQSIIDACMELDIPFGCQSGVCGSCYMEVKKGEENLSEPNQNEKDMGFESPRRLACQCVLKSGDILIER